MSNILFNKHSFIGAEQKTGKESSEVPITYTALENVHLSKENCFHWEPPVVPDLVLTHAVLTWLGYWTDRRKINGRKIRYLSTLAPTVSECNVGTAIFWLKSAQRQHLGACDRSAANPTMLHEPAPKPAHTPPAAPGVRASIAQLCRSREDPGITRSRSTGRSTGRSNVPF